MALEKKIHLNPETGESSVCRAQTPQSCKFYTPENGAPEHYHTHKQAREAFERMMENNGGPLKPLVKQPTQKTLIVPDHGKLAPVTHEEVSAILEERRIPEQKLVGYMLGGSFMRNLDTPESDRDIWIYTSEIDKHKKSKSKATEEDDYSISTLHDVLNAPRGHFEQLEGKLLTINHNNPAAAMFNNIRPSMYDAIRSQRGNQSNNALMASKNAGMYDRVVKFSKRTLVAKYVERKIADHLVDRQNYNPRFSEEERNKFYQELHGISNDMKEIYTDKNRIKDYLERKIISK